MCPAKSKSSRRALTGICVGLAMLGCVWAASAHTIIVNAAKGRTYSDVAAIPARRVAVVMGCSRVLPDGRRNMFFANRIQAAAQLFQAHKAEYLIVSGDNHSRDYDEPQDMKDALIAAGVPASRIACDYAGFRTLDSIVRAREVFGQSQFVVVSQAFHNERAIFIAQHSGIDVIGFNAPEVDAYNGFKTKCREVVSRSYVMLDLFVFHTRPKFLGEKILLPA